MNASSETHSGGCLCGAVTYDVNGPLRNVIECHCETCRRMSGGLWHGSAAMKDDIEIHDINGALSWYRSSEKAQRGFCKTCGSTLFFRRDGGDYPRSSLRRKTPVHSTSPPASRSAFASLPIPRPTMATGKVTCRTMEPGHLPNISMSPKSKSAGEITKWEQRSGNNKIA